jgi:hypothetical protein
MNLIGDGHNFLDEYLPEPIFKEKEDLFDRAKIEAAVGIAIEKVLGKMDEIWPQLDDIYRAKIEKIAEDEKADPKRVGAEYLVQERIFFELSKFFELIEADTFSKTSADGLVALTDSNSFVIATPPDERDRRIIEYIRIPSRKESWDGETTMANGKFERNIQTQDRLIVEGGLSTSPIKAIAVIPSGKAEIIESISESVHTATHFTVSFREGSDI